MCTQNSQAVMRDNEARRARILKLRAFWPETESARGSLPAQKTEDRGCGDWQDWRDSRHGTGVWGGQETKRRDCGAGISDTVS